MQLYFVSFFLFIAKTSYGKLNSLVINAVGDNRESIIQAIGNVANFQESILRLGNSKFWNNLDCHIFTYRNAYENLPIDVKGRLSKFSQCSITFYNRSSITDRSVARHLKENEQVSVILESVSTITQLAPNGTKILSMTMSNATRLMATKDFLNVFSIIGREAMTPGISSSMGNSVILLGKTRRMTSVSDWHDLLLLGLLASTHTSTWVRKVNEVYFHHAANRTAFTLLDPRPALLEASLQLRHVLKVGHFRRGEVCVRRSRKDGSMIGSVITQVTGSEEGSSSHCKVGKSLVELSCLQGRYYQSCVTVDEPNMYKHSFERRIDNLGDKLRLSRDRWQRDLYDRLEYGTLRFQTARDTGTLGSFCWEGNSTTDYVIKSRVYMDAKNSLPYSANTTAKRSRIALLSGCHGTAYNLDYRLYPNLAKMYYCKRHGYQFVHQLSNQLLNYFPPNLWETIEGGIGNTGKSTFKGTMSKVLMIIDTLLRFPHAEWIVWMDDDTWINPGFLHVPLEAYLVDVPDDKVFVQANYRTMFTNMFFWRNNVQGRRLAYDWLAVAMSGHVQCHGFDQAALQMLALQRLRGVFDVKPFGTTCVWHYSSVEAGCNEKGDYSCDFKFERALYRSGYRSRSSNFHNGMISSYTKGCANDYFPEFHVVTETSSRPRMQCCYCFELDYIDADHCFDGPLCGGNDWLRRGAIDGWFAGHKSWFYFFEVYLNHENCKAMPYTEFVPTCRADKVTAFLQEPSNAKGFISLADGFAYDLDDGGAGYCRGNDALLAYQKKTSYMREYGDMIRAVKSDKDFDWKKAYDKEVTRITGRAGRPIIPSKPRSHDFEPEDLCQKKCKLVPNVQAEGLPVGKRMAVDCLY